MSRLSRSEAVNCKIATGPARNLCSGRALTDLHPHSLARRGECAMLPNRRALAVAPLDNLSEEQARFTIEVLEMFASLQRSLQNLEDDHDGLSGEDVEFPGFDACSERSYMDYARHCHETLECFADLKTRSGCNSERPIRWTYSEMLSAWRPLATRRFQLSAAEIRNILFGIGRLT
jgi:uncharacterized protein YfbU (UPF0304 family)